MRHERRINFKISVAGLVNYVFTDWLCPSATGEKHGIIPSIFTKPASPSGRLVKREEEEETKAVKTELQKKREPNGDARQADGGRRFMSFVWKLREGFSRRNGRTALALLGKIWS